MTTNAVLRRTRRRLVRETVYRPCCSLVCDIAHLTANFYHKNGTVVQAAKVAQKSNTASLANVRLWTQSGQTKTYVRTTPPQFCGLQKLWSGALLFPARVFEVAVRYRSRACVDRYLLRRNKPQAARYSYLSRPCCSATVTTAVIMNEHGVSR